MVGPGTQPETLNVSSAPMAEPECFAGIADAALAAKPDAVQQGQPRPVYRPARKVGAQRL